MTPIINILGFLLPLELVFSMAAHGVFSGTIGPVYKILQLQTLFFPFLVVLLLKKDVRLEKTLCVAALAFLSIGILELVMTLFNDAQIGLAVSQLFFGFVFPVCLVLLLSSFNVQNKYDFFTAFYIGYALFLTVAILLAVFVDDSLLTLYSNYGIEGALIALRYNDEGQLFHLLVGNTNKQSNYLIILMALAPSLLGINSQEFCRYPRVARLAFVLFVIVAAVCVLLMFSRAAVFLLPCVLFLLRSRLPLFLTRLLSVAFFLMATTFLIRLFSESESVSALGYLVNSSYIDGTSSGVFGSIGERSDLFFDYFENVLDGYSLFFGIGVGSYGIRWGGDPNITAHNLYLHHFATSGLFAWLILFSITAHGLFKAVYTRDVLLVFSWVAFLIFSYRDYAFSDLYVGSMGGLVYMLLLAATYNRWVSSNSLLVKAA